MIKLADGRIKKTSSAAGHSEGYLAPQSAGDREGFFETEGAGCWKPGPGCVFQVDRTASGKGTQLQALSGLLKL